MPATGFNFLFSLVQEVGVPNQVNEVNINYDTSLTTTDENIFLVVLAVLKNPGKKKYHMKRHIQKVTTKKKSQDKSNLT